MKLRTKRRLRDTGILVAVFIVAVMIFSHFTNQGNESMTADMGAATFPEISFSYHGYSINNISGYAKEMDMTAVRDSITPVTSGNISLEIDAHDQKITQIDYRIYSLDGKEELLSDSIENPKEDASILLQDTTILEEERVLELVVNLENDQKVYYYTRIRDSQDMNALSCLDYIRDFHENALAKAEGAGIGTAIEPSDEGDTSSFYHVTIHSDYDHVTWGELKPQIEGNVRWSIKEMNSVYTSVVLEYSVHCKGEENEMDEYNVQEFFRVRHIATAEQTYLLDYDRTMEQIFNPTQVAFSEKGVLLGIGNPDVQYMVNGDGSIVAFVQANELWSYNKNTDEVSLVFSFSSTENTDDRNRVSKHEVKLLDCDEFGNLMFAVYGYMNRGEHEGEVGVAIYNYNISQNSVEEQVFIATNKSSGHVVEELKKLVYYDATDALLYVLANGTIYEMNLNLNTENILAENLEEHQYRIAEDSSLIAYQTNEDVTKAQEIVIKNLTSGSERTIKCAEDECIQPLGFVGTDVVCGIAKVSDVGMSASGEMRVLMYKVQICNKKGGVIKEYEQEGIYVLNAEFEDGLITLERAKKKGSGYKNVADDYITNNEAADKSNIYLESYTTELKRKQMRLTYSDGLADKEPKILKPKQVFSDKPKEVTFDNMGAEKEFYVYGHGRLRGIFEDAGEAILCAEEYKGVVISWEQQYVWERGNRDLQYQLDSESELVKQVQRGLETEESPLQVMEELSDGKSLDLTGCTTEELLYVINQGTPVVGIVGKDSPVILVGYGDTTVTYLDAKTGTKSSVTFEKMDEMTKASGHSYIGMMN